MLKLGTTKHYDCPPKLEMCVYARYPEWVTIVTTTFQAVVLLHTLVNTFYLVRLKQQ